MPDVRGAGDQAQPDPAAWISEAIVTGRLQRLRPSMSAAGEMINRAREHLRSAQVIAASDPTLAITACHDAARQAVTAHMRAAGYRPANEAGAHRFVVEYAHVVLNNVISHDDISKLDELRRDRHTAEYGDFASQTISADRARDAHTLATGVVNAVATSLATGSQESPTA